MSYDETAAMFLAPLAEEIAAPALPETPARRLRDALEPIATQGWWSRPVGERLDALGVPPFAAYAWGRCAPLGHPEPAAVVEAFGVFEPALITQAYLEGRQLLSREAILDARASGAADAVATVADEAQAEAVAGPLLASLAGLDGLGRPLFSALRALPPAPSAAGRLWQAAELVREHRGDGHLAALAVADVDAVEANILTELWCGYPLGEYTATRGFGQEAIAAGAERLVTRGWMAGHQLTRAGIAAREGIEAATDLSQRRLVDALGDGLDDLVDAAAAISERLLAAGWFPPDPRKRAAG